METYLSERLASAADLSFCFPVYIYIYIIANSIDVSVHITIWDFTFMTLRSPVFKGSVGVSICIIVWGGGCVVFVGCFLL